MFIQTETTPNPATLKFLPGRALAESGPREFRSVEEAKGSPLAARLFEIEGVTGVFVGADFLTVSKALGGLDWPQLKAPVLAAIMDHFTSGEPLFADAAQAGAETEGDAHAAYEGEAGQVVAEISGDILFDRFEPETGVLWLQMRGACAGCPSSSATLKAGVENMMRHYVPEVTRVEQVQL
jgi:Fe-S cluster biogenesis protein NfuA